MEMNRRTLLEVVAGFMAASASLPAADLPATLYDPGNVRAESHSYGTLKIYCDGPTAGLQHLVVGSIVLKPGEQPHPPHTHVDEELLLVTEGTGQITLNGNPSASGAGALMYVPPNYLHGIKNTGDQPLTFYFIKWVAKSAESK